MLEPRERRHLMEVLRPPPGYELDRAVGTTYSLDLLALLTAPLAFTIFEAEGEDGRTASDPLTLLETMRRYARRLSIFCQAGRISVPKSRQLLFGYLEDSVFEVTAPKAHGAFHPKVWALRYVAPEMPVRYRYLCLSRNLTFDRSWDTVLALDGELTNRANAIGRNHPLGDFITALPDLALRPLPERTREDVDRIQHEIRRVDFAIPEGFETLSFVPLGIRRTRRWFFNGRIDRMLVVSPFVSDNTLDRLSGEANASILVSRLESLDALKQSRRKDFDDVYVLNPSAVPEEGGEETTESSSSALYGLHAKLYVADAGWKARVWTGSANATNAAFERNVEFLVELGGKKGACGIDSLLGPASEDGKTESDVTGLISLLQRYVPAGEPSVDKEEAGLEYLTETARRALSAANWSAKASELPGETERFEIRFGLDEERAPDVPREVGVRCWPITRPEVEADVSPGSVETMTFRPLSFEALTSFFAFEVTADSEEASVSRMFSVNVPLEGAPPERQERILRTLLDSSEKVLRLILLLLAEGGEDQHEGLIAAQRMLGSITDGDTRNGSGPASFPLFEALVRTLERNPSKLDQIARLLEDLHSTPESKRLVPEGLDDVWQQMMEARRRLET
jgi:hypothetical protein